MAEPSFNSVPRRDVFNEDESSLFLARARMRAYAEDYCRRRQAEADILQCQLCCRQMCVLGRRLCCLGRMSSVKRVQILWGWIVLLTIISVFITAFVFYGQKDYSASPTDMRLVTDNISPVFCTGVYLTASLSSSESGSFLVYLYGQKPQILQDYRELYKHKESVFFSQKQHRAWRYFLLEGSSVNVRSCSDLSGLDMFIIKGKSDMDMWLSNPHCDKCYMRYAYLTGDCLNERYDQVTFSVDDTDDYYFVFVSSSLDEWSNVKFYLNRTVYDPSEALTCHPDQNNECYIPLNLGNQEHYVVFQTASNWTSGEELLTRCDYRPWIFVDVFFLVPLICGTVLTMLVCRVFKEPSITEQLSPEDWRQNLSPRGCGRQLTERTPLLCGFPRNPAFPVAPPKYDHVVSEIASNPPSYAETVAPLAVPGCLVIAEAK